MTGSSRLLPIPLAHARDVLTRVDPLHALLLGVVASLSVITIVLSIADASQMLVAFSVAGSVLGAIVMLAVLAGGEWLRKRAWGAEEGNRRGPLRATLLGSVTALGSLGGLAMAVLGFGDRDERLAALGLLVLLSGGLATCAALAARGTAPTDPRMVERRAAVDATGDGLVLLLAPVALLLGLTTSLFWSVEARWAVAMVLVTLLAVWLTLGALYQRSAGQAAITLFVAMVLWSGALGFVQEIGDLTPDLNRAQVVMTDGTVQDGYLLGDTGSTLYLADLEPGPEGRSVMVIEAEDVDEVTYGGERILAEVDCPKNDEECEEQSRREEGGGTESAADQLLGLLDLLVALGRLGDPSAEGESEREPVIGTPEGEPLAAKGAWFDGARVQLLVTQTARDGDFVLVDARLVNRSERPVRFHEVFPLDPGRRLGDMEALDASADRVYEVSRSRGECACSEELGATAIAPGRSLMLAASFEIPPSAGSSVSLRVPGFGWVEDVPIP